MKHLINLKSPTKCFPSDVHHSNCACLQYLGRQNGFRGGSLLHLAGGAELGGGAGPGRCSVLGLTRALGTEAAVRRHGVRRCSPLVSLTLK